MTARSTIAVLLLSLAGAILLLLPLRRSSSPGRTPQHESTSAGTAAAGVPAEHLPAALDRRALDEPRAAAASTTSRRLQVRFLHDDGRPFAWIPVAVTDRARTFSLGVTAKTDGRTEIDCSAPRGSTLEFTSPGFAPASKVLGSREVRSLDLGDVVFAPLASLTVRVLHAPERSEPWLNLIVETPVLSEKRVLGGDVVLGQQMVATPAAEAEVPFRLPCEYPLRVRAVERGAWSLRLEYPVPALAAGETRELTIDFARYCTVSGRLVHLPLEAAGSRDVVLQVFAGFTESQHEPAERRMVTGEGGTFRFLGIPPDAWVRLALVADDRVPLHDFNGADVWAARVASDLELEPAEPVVGVALEDLQSNLLRDRPFAVSLGKSVVFQAWRHPDGVELLRGSGLVAADALYVDVGQSTILRLAGSALTTNGDRLVRIRVPPSEEGCGRIEAEVSGTRPQDVDLVVSASNAGPGIVGCRIVPQDRGWHLEALSPGRYDLSWRTRWWQDRCAAGVEVNAGTTTTVHLERPRRRWLDGVITNWAAIPDEIKPREIRIEGSLHELDHERFRTAVDPSAANEASFLVWPLQVVRAKANARYCESLDRLEVEFPVADLALRDVVVPPRFGGRPDVWYATSPAAGLDQVGPLWLDGLMTAGLTRVSAADGSDSVALLWQGEPLIGVAWESVPGQRVFRGWFRVDGGATIGEPFPGRTVELRWIGATRFVEVWLQTAPLGDWQPRPVKVARTITTQPLRVWVPEQATALIVDACGRRQTLSLASAQSMIEVAID